MGLDFGDGTLLTGDVSLDSTIPLQPIQSYGVTARSYPTPSKIPSAGTFALMTQVMGGINSAIGAYYGAQAQQYQAKSQAVNLGYQSAIAAINARQSEYQAESDLKAGQSQVFNTTMAEGQQKAAATVNMAARGLRAGTGTTAEISGSMDLMKDIDVYNIDANSVAAAAAARTQSTNYQNQSNLDRVSAANMNKSASSISPFTAGFSSLLTTASSVASGWNNAKRMQMYLANGGYMSPMMGGFN